MVVCEKLGILVLDGKFLIKNLNFLSTFNLSEAKFTHFYWASLEIESHYYATKNWTGTLGIFFLF